MAEGCKHKRYKTAIAKFIDGKIVTIQNELSFSVLECRPEKNTLITGGKSRKHDLVATVLPLSTKPLRELINFQGGEFEPIMLPAHGGDPQIKKNARHLIVHGAREGYTVSDIIRLQSEGKSVGSRPDGEAPEEKYPQHQLIIEIWDGNKKKREHKDEIEASGHYAIEIKIKDCPDEPNDSILKKIIPNALWLVPPEIAELHNRQLNYWEQVEAIITESGRIIGGYVRKEEELDLVKKAMGGKQTPATRAALERIIDSMDESDAKTLSRLFEKLEELVEGIGQCRRMSDDLRAAKARPGGQTRFLFGDDQ